MGANFTKPTSIKEIKREWHVIDAKDKIVGRLASEVAQLLMGKSKAYFTRNIDCGDHVVVINAKYIKIGGKKAEEKIYYRHSGYPGGLKGEAFQDLQKRKPEDIVIRGVKGMLPQNKLRDLMLNRLHVFAEAEHTFGEQVKK